MAQARHENEMKTAEAAYNSALAVIDSTIGRAQQYSERMLGLNGAKLTDAALGIVTQPANLRGTLREYQLQGYRWIVRRAFAGESIILGDEMGLGKTVQVRVPYAPHPPTARTQKFFTLTLYTP